MTGKLEQISKKSSIIWVLKSESLAGIIKWQQ